MSQALNANLPLYAKDQNADFNWLQVKLFRGDQNDGQYRQLHKMDLLLCWRNFERKTAADFHCPCFATAEAKMVSLC